MEDLQREYDQLGASAKAMKLTRQVVERLDEMAAFAPGKKAPDFTLPTPEGDSLSMYSIQGKVKILDFWASWCGPCRMVSPIVDEIAAENPDKKVGKVNVDEEPELASKFDVMSIPTLLVFEDGELVNRAVGARPKEMILDLFEE